MMPTAIVSTEELIRAVLADIRQKGYSSIHPFSIGKVEQRMLHFAQSNPQNRFSMDLYFDGDCFIYTDGQSKFIVHPNYKMKISREIVKQVNFITATKVKDPMEFTLPKYQKI